MNLAQQARETRLSFWGRLFHGLAVAPTEIDREILSLVRNSSEGERIAFILLRACAAIGIDASPATKRTLRTAILYWFSNSGSKDGNTEDDIDLRHADLRAIVGLHLSWRESALVFGANPNDYTAYHRFLQRLQEECTRQWIAVFGESAGQPFKVTKIESEK
jgi:hypothetical protein